jgi:hypothetical protein
MRWTARWSCREGDSSTMSRDQTLRRRTVATHASEHGVAMIGMLIVIVILGVLAAIVLSQQGSPTPQQIGGASQPGAAATTIPRSIASGAQLSTITACEADFESVASALASYRAVNNVDPAAGTAWATSAALGGPYLQSWPSGAGHYTIWWDGSVLSVVPAKGAASHGSFGTSSPATGCDAA